VRESATQIIERLGLWTIRGDELSPYLDIAIDNLPQAVADLRAGNRAALNALVGHVMSCTNGRANGEEARQRIENRIYG